MSTKCFACTEAISSCDFIKCEGICGQKFHSKCVSLNKTTLNAIISCPNIHWLCHDCNNGNKMMNASIDNLTSAVDNLKQSMTSDLLAGFKLLTESLSTTLSATIRTPLSADCKNPTKRRRNEYEVEEEPMTRSKRFANAFNNNPDKHRSFTIRNPNETRNSNFAVPETNRRKSIVISNIDRNISPEYLDNYLSKELTIDKSTIRTTLLKPTGIADESLKFVQFRISVPESVYSRARAQDTWPNGVRVRDYVFNRRGRSNLLPSVSEENFLSKNASQTHMHQHTQSVVDVHAAPGRCAIQSTETPTPMVEMTDVIDAGTEEVKMD